VCFLFLRLFFTNGGKIMVTINGKQVDAAGKNILAYLSDANYHPQHIVVERNEEIVPREQYANTVLIDNDCVEIVSFMGGGQEADDPLIIGGHTFHSRFILGSGKYSLRLIEAAVQYAGAELITLSVRRANTRDQENILDFIPQGITLLPNTSGARDAHEAVRIARLARELGCGNFIKIEIMRDSKYLLPDNQETIRATEILAKEGFVVMPYMYPDLNVARDLANAGAATIMPLAAPIGSNRGLATKEFIQILVDEIELPIIVDAGIGKPSQACEAMEMGAAAIMANTALATAGDLPRMAGAFRQAIQAGRSAYLSGLGRVLTRGASPSDPLTGFLRN
jgi:thiazole synthase